MHSDNVIMDSEDSLQLAAFDQPMNVNLILRDIEEGNVTQRDCEKLISALSGSLESLPQSSLVKLVDICCKTIQAPNDNSTFASWKELLPPLMQLIVNIETLDHGGSQLSGETFKNNIITSLCMADWKSSIIVDLAAMFVDMPLNKEERSRVVRKFCSRLAASPIDLIPPLSHHMVFLTRSEEITTLFMALNEYFNQHLYIDESKTPGQLDALTSMEGTVLYHFINNVGPAGMKELAKTMKECRHSPEIILQPFTLTLLLGLSSTTQAAESEILPLLRGGLLRALTEEDKLTESAWFRTVCPAPVKVQQIVSRVLENCFRGRDNVLKGLISMAFSLFGNSRCRDIEDRLKVIGSTIIEDLVKRHRLVTGNILDQLGNHILQTPDSAHYIECLSVLARKQPLNLLECSTLLLNLIDNMCTLLPGQTLAQVLRSLLPLTRLSLPVRDNLVMLLRKSLFSHDLSRRIMAVKGFLEILRDLKISNLQTLSQSMSQNYCKFTQLCSQSLTGGASLSNEGLCLEVLALLREVFKHQHQVKSVLYRGLYTAVRANPELGSHVLEFIHSHMEKYFQSDETKPPFHFDKLVAIQGTEAIVQEPLGDLILCLALIVSKLEDDIHVDKLLKKIQTISERMSSCDVASFQLELECGTCILDPMPEAQEKQETLRQILGTLEALMGFTLCSWNKGSSEKSNLFWSLFRAFTCLSDYARGLGKERKKGEGKAKGKPQAFKFPATVLDLKCCCRLLALINNVSVDWATEEPTVNLSGKRELHRYALQVTSSLIQDIRAAPSFELSRNCFSLGYLCKIASILYRKYVTKISEMKAFDLTTAVSSMQCFCDLMSLILSHFKGKFKYFLAEITGDSVTSQGCEPLESILTALLEQFSDVLSEEDAEEEGKEDLQAKKMSVLFLALISTLLNQVPAGAPCLKTAFERVKEECESKPLEKPGVAKSLLSLLLALQRRCDDSPTLLLHISLCLCSCMHLIDDETEIEEHPKYKLVNARTGNVCLVALCDALQIILCDIDWMINRLKSEISFMRLPSTRTTEMQRENLRERERALCNHFIMCAKVLSALCSIAVPPGVYSDSVLKCLEIMYSKLTLMTKYCTIRVTKFQESLEGMKFVKTVRIVDSVMTKNMYCFTEHVIADGSGDASGVNPSVLKQRTLKETKLIPKVVFEKEQYHKFLLQLSKRSKLDLVSKTKHTMARDYRLYAKQVRKVLDLTEDTAEVDQMEVEESVSPSSSPSSKRMRSSQCSTTYSASVHSQSSP